MRTLLNAGVLVHNLYTYRHLSATNPSLVATLTRGCHGIFSRVDVPVSLWPCSFLHHNHDILAGPQISYSFNPSSPLFCKEHPSQSTKPTASEVCMISGGGRELVGQQSGFYDTDYHRLFQCDDRWGEFGLHNERPALTKSFIKPQES